MAAKATAAKAPPPSAKPAMTLADTVRNALRVAPAVKTKTLNATREELAASAAELEQQIEWLQSQQEDALLESAAAYAENATAIEQAAAQLKHVNALRDMVTKALAESREGDVDTHVLEVGRNAKALRDAAVAGMKDYEKLAKLIAAMLAPHEAVFDAIRDFEYVLKEKVEYGNRTKEWAQQMRVTCLGTDQDEARIMAALHVLGRDRLCEVVQLPSSVRVEPYFGDVAGRVFEAIADQLQREEEARGELPPAREFGVYDGEGRKLGSRSLPPYEPTPQNSVMDRVGRV